MDFADSVIHAYPIMLQAYASRNCAETETAYIDTLKTADTKKTRRRGIFRFYEHENMKKKNTILPELIIRKLKLIRNLLKK